VGVKKEKKSFNLGFSGGRVSYKMDLSTLEEDKASSLGSHSEDINRMREFASTSSPLKLSESLFKTLSIMKEPTSS